MATTASSPLDLLMARLVKYQEIADQVNQACAEKGCPPAFDIQLSPNNESNDIRIRASEDYRFEGFGSVFGFPPKLSFWVHHVPKTGDQVEIGRFLVPINFGDLAQI
ncbi:hypothetical protein C7271_26610 [filamentous cyanobacterium CCP5]|nr:hypothetical protein C7271_26610 [filamentous cyanobacterium CCP5]